MVYVRVGGIRAECMDPDFRKDLTDIIELRKVELKNKIHEWEGQFKYYQDMGKKDPSYKTDADVLEYVDMGKDVVKALQDNVNSCNEILGVFEKIPNC